MRYLWFNPVILAMYGQEQLEAFAIENNYQPIYCEQDWGEYVKQRYARHLEESSHTIIDMRCPKAVELLKQQYSMEGYILPPIEPILIHCARELQARISEEDSLVITTPCTSLADYGNQLHLRNTVFTTLNHFATSLNCRLICKPLDQSPIPPGFFKELTNDIVSISSKEDIEDYFSKNKRTSPELIELLYCSQGCHKGDGITL